MIRPIVKKILRSCTILVRCRANRRAELVKRMGYEFEGAREYFKAVVAENQMWVYEMDGVPVGFLGIQGDYIDRLYVAPNFIGAVLARHCLTMPAHYPRSICG
jgi:hypothetical protein